METRSERRRRISWGTIVLFVICIGIATLLVFRDPLVRLLQYWFSQPPQVQIESQPSGGPAPLTVQIRAIPSSNAQNQIVNYDWDFGDGFRSSQKNSNHTYEKAGEYRLTLIVTDELGLTYETGRLIQISPPLNPPTTEKPEEIKPESTPAPILPEPIWVVVPTEVFSGQQAIFTVENENAYRNVPGLAFYWDFNMDGLTDEVGATAYHTFPYAGNYSVTLQVYRNGTKVREVTRALNVSLNRPPVARFDFNPYNPQVGKPISFDASLSLDQEGTIIAYKWDFNGDGNTDATGEQVYHVFERSGTYNVSLRVVDNLGSESYTATDVKVTGFSQSTKALATIVVMVIAVLAYLIYSKR